jgi:hypothetical protein
VFFSRVVEIVFLQINNYFEFRPTESVIRTLSNRNSGRLTNVQLGLGGHDIVWPNSYNLASLKASDEHKLFKRDLNRFD